MTTFTPFPPLAQLAADLAAGRTTSRALVDTARQLPPPHAAPNQGPEADRNSRCPGLKQAISQTQGEPGYWEH
ncbi:hypothetical protein, partial [Burkholderia sp. Ac-20345]|uniref:hypothetical protein n=1 Tax=Burkholderia sp. Ac-20345 TaxID=2703891 RepID=UPI00197B2C18